MKKVGIIVVLVLLQSACASNYTSNGEQHYLKSRNGVNMIVPPPLTTDNISHFYDLTPQNQRARVSIIPPV